MKISVTVQHDKYDLTLTMNDDQSKELFLADYLEFLKTSIQAAGFSYVIDLAAMTSDGTVMPATESIDHWYRAFVPETRPNKRNKK